VVCGPARLSRHQNERAVNVLTGWAALYCVPAMLTFARGVRLGRVIKIAGRIVLIGLPFAGFYGLLNFAMSAYIGLIRRN
jgi:hypothetical protein